MTTLTGLDLSHWNKVTSITKLATAGFVVHKATEGTGYVDLTFKDRAKKLRAAGARFGTYHFATGLDPDAEAAHYLKVAQPRPRELMMLDIEAKIIKMPGLVPWCVTFIKAIHKKTGIWPLIYMSSAVTTQFNWKPVADLGVKLWAARYATAEPAAGAFGSWSIWQYTSKGSAAGVVGNVDVNRVAAGVTWDQLIGGSSTPPPAASLTGPKPEIVKSAKGLHKVVTGDTLSKIAIANGTTWQKLVKLNADRYPQLASNPNLITPGMKLIVTAGTKPPNKTYTVKADDTLSKIAAGHKTTVRALVELNHSRYQSLVKDPNLILTGWVLFLP